MMNPTELRIGNLVYVPKTDQIVPVTAIQKHIGVQVNDNILAFLGFDEIKPIKSTKEWLKKLGFTEFPNCFILQENGFKIQ